MFYLPMLYYPIQDDDRATGFLIPTYGASTRARAHRSATRSSGRSIAARTPRSFTTGCFRAATAWAPSTATCWRRKRRETFAYYYLNENAVVINGQQQQARRSTRMTGDLSQGLPFRLSARAQRRLLHRRDGAAALQQQLLRCLAKQRAVFGRHLRRVAGPGGERQLSAHRDIRPARVIPRSWATQPGLTASCTGYKLGFLPVFASINAEAGQGDVHPELRQDGQRPVVDEGGPRAVDAGAAQHAAVPARSTPRRRIAPPISARASPPTSRRRLKCRSRANYADMRLDVVGPVFSRVFNPNNAIADRLKHIIEPSYSVQRRSEIPSQDRIPRRPAPTTRSSATPRSSATA